MGYTYHGASGLIKTGEATVVFPSGLIQKKVTVVRRRGKFIETFTRATDPLSESESNGQLGTGFFAFPAIVTATDLYNGFIQYDIVGYAKGSGLINSVINYKYRKLSSFIVEDQFRPQTVNISVEVGVRSTVVLTAGTQTTTEDENGDSQTTTIYEAPGQYQGQLIAYNENGSVFRNLSVTERYIYTNPVLLVTTDIVYEPITVVESVSSTYYGHFTEYITTSSLKIVRRVLS